MDRGTTRGETMNRRLAIATMFLVLALLCLLLVGMSSATRASGTPGPAVTGAPAGAALPHPSPVPAPQVAFGTMSGEFADTHLACLGGGRAPSIYVPSDRWFRGHPGWRHTAAPAHARGAARWC
jgi:hypothetical protein